MYARRFASATVSGMLILAFVAAIIAFGCAPGMPPEPEWEKNATALLNDAENFYAKKQYAQALQTVDAFFQRFPKSRHADRAYYLIGEVKLTQRDYRQALAHYKEIIERFPQSPFIIDAKYKLGLCYYELKEYDPAIANLQDRSKITDPAKRKMTAQMLSNAYLVKKNYLPALREFVLLQTETQDPKQQAGYRDRVRELIEKFLSEDELKTLASDNAYPSDLAQLRLAALLIEQRNYRDSLKVSKDFLDRFPGHPERTRAEMLQNEATSKLTAPRYMMGALLPRTGQLAFFGDRVLKGVQLAIHTYNLENPDNRVELLILDTEGSSEKAVLGLQELVAKKAVAAIGPITTREEDAIIPSLENLKIPFVRPTASRAGFTIKSNWVFRNALTIDSQAEAAAQYAQAGKFRRFVMLYPDEPYGKDLSSLFTRALERKAEVLTSVAYPPETKDFGPWIRKIMEIDLRSRKIVLPEDEAERKKILAEYVPGFDALYMPGYAERVGLLIPQLAFYNINGLAMIGSDNWHSPDLIERAGRHADGAVFVDGFFPESQYPAVKSFVDAYRSAYQEEPDILAAQAYDAAMMVCVQLKEKKETPQAVRDGLLALKDYPGVSGSTTFNGLFEAQKKLFFIKIEDGKFTLLNGGK